MRILIIQPVNKKNGITGGTYGSKRIIDILKAIYNQENIDIFEVNYYSSKIKAFIYNSILLCDGLTFKTIRNIKKIAIQYDIVFVNTTKLGIIAKKLYRKNKIFSFAHNNEVVFVKQYLKSMSLLKKIMHLPLLLSVVYNEKLTVKFSSCLFCLNNRDSELFNKLYGRKADFLMPISFNDNYNENKNQIYKNVNEKFILFVGADFFGNTEGLFWFIENVLDSISIKLLVVGSGMDKYSTKYENKNVEFIGFVEDIEQYYYSCEAVVLPIFSGAGMKTKTCEALMYGKNIIGSKEAFEGYDIEYERIGALCNSKEEFINEIEKINSEDYKKYNKYSREVFLKKYETTTLIDEFKKFLSNREKSIL